MSEPIKGIFNKKNVVVVGGAGFIGSHICESILMSGEAKVICIDNLVSGSIVNIERLLQSPDFKFIRHDMVNPIDLGALQELAAFEIEFEGIQEIYNCATPTSYKDAKKFAVQTALTNSLGTKHVLDMAKQYSAKMVHLSTSAVYGDPLPENPHFSEDYWGFIDPVGDRASYNEGKRFSETLCKVYQDMGVHVRIARVFSTYGPRMIMDEGRHIPDFVSAALDNKDIVIYGEQNKVSSFCYVKDMLDGLKRLIDSNVTEPVNLGNAEQYTLKSIAEIVITLTGSTSKIVFEEAITGISDQGLPNITKAKDALGWFPVVTLDQGLKETIDYMRSAKSQYVEKGLWDQSTLDRKE